MIKFLLLFCLGLNVWAQSELDEDFLRPKGIVVQINEEGEIEGVFENRLVSEDKKDSVSAIESGIEMISRSRKVNPVESASELDNDSSTDAWFWNGFGHMPYWNGGFGYGRNFMNWRFRFGHYNYFYSWNYRYFYNNYWWNFYW